MPMTRAETTFEARSASLLLPRPSLATCIVLGVVRDTRGRTLAHEDRFNHFPLSPYCSLTWHVEGRLHLVKTDAEAKAPETGAPLPRLMVSGPGSGPVTTWSAGPVFVLTVSFYPDVWEALTGTSVLPLFDKHVAGENVLPPDLVETLLPVFREAGAEQSFACFEEQIAQRWAQRRSKGGVSPFWMRDWATALAARAALSSTGRSLRQLQRRVKHQTGRTQRELALLVRNEELFARVMSDEPGTAPDHAGLAVDAGFADQAHMIREVRRMTGMPPARILRLIATEESYWPYRLLGMRYG